VAKFLLDAGSDPNARDLNGQTPLHLCMINDFFGSIQKLLPVLLEGKADVNAQNHKGRTPLHNLVMKHSDREECAGMAKLLLDAGADALRRNRPLRKDLL
jgi:ankyrin repeat protein